MGKSDKCEQRILLNWHMVELANTVGADGPPRTVFSPRIRPSGLESTPHGGDTQMQTPA